MTPARLAKPNTIVLKQEKPLLEKKTQVETVIFFLVILSRERQLAGGGKQTSLNGSFGCEKRSKDGNF